MPGPGFNLKINATKEEALKQLEAGRTEDAQQLGVYAAIKAAIERAPAGVNFEIVAGGHEGESEGAITLRFMYRKA